MTRKPVQLNRKSIKVRRKAITMLTRAGHTKFGGWFLFDKPEGQEPPKYQTKIHDRVLWCPFCGEWTIYKYNREMDRHECQGYCGGAHTDMSHVKTANDLWFEDVPLADLRKVDLSILKPTNSRRRI